MAEIVPAVIKHCANNAAITAAFGARIWGNKIPDLPGGGAHPFPYARMREISNAPKYTHQGRAGRGVLVQVDIYDANEINANTNAALIESVFDGYKGVMGATVDAGMIMVKSGTGSWNPETRSYWRIVELEILTND
jgi:hypothetical protein